MVSGTTKLTSDRPTNRPNSPPVPPITGSNAMRLHELSKPAELVFVNLQFYCLALKGGLDGGGSVAS